MHRSFSFNQQVEIKKKLTDPCIHTKDVHAGISSAALLYSASGDFSHQNTQISAAAIACKHWSNGGFLSGQFNRSWLLDWLLLNRQQCTQSESRTVPNWQLLNWLTFSICAPDLRVYNHFKLLKKSSKEPIYQFSLRRGGGGGNYINRIT